MKKILSSERLYLREFIENDLDQLIHLDTNPEVLKYIGKPRTREKSIERMQKAFDDYARGEGLGKWMAVEKNTGNPIGWYVLNYLDNTELVEIGYRLKEEYWGKGYATEMSHHLLKYGFETLGLNKIAGVTHPDNEGSKKVLQKIGLKYIGLKFYYQQDVSYFELTK